MRKILFLFLLFGVSCQTSKHVFPCENKHVLKYQSKDIIEKEFVIGIEKCKKNDFSFCENEFGRLSPRMIVFDSTDIIRSYYNGVFIYYYGWQEDSTLKDILGDTKWIPPLASDDQDTNFVYPFVCKDSTAELKIKSAKYFKSVKKYEKGMLPMSKKRYESLDYALYNVKMKYIYAGETCIVLPNIKGDLDKKILFVSIKVPCYYIIEILSVKEYEKDKVFVIKY